MRKIASYIEQRIRQCPPTDSFIIEGSTPIISFGDSSSAQVATLGLNPSKVEFLDNKGGLLKNTARRLATYQSLEISELHTAPEGKIREVLSDCNNYFSRNPYRWWFDQLEPILQSCETSYYNSTACHLDLVQWATNPVWGSLKPKTVREKLIQADLGFLKKQLSQENIRLVLLNGNGVISEVKRRFETELNEADPICGLGHHKTRLFEGVILDKVRVIGWSTNLQSSFGVTNLLRKEIAQRVAALAKKIKYNK